MTKYISREAAVDAGYLSDWYISSVGDEPPVWTDAHIDELLNDFIVIPKDTKASDVRPVIHAYWIRGKEYGFRTNNSMWYCSNCGGSIRYDTTLRTYQKHKKPVEEVNPFCRKCGAIMDRSVIFAR